VSPTEQVCNREMFQSLLHLSICFPQEGDFRQLLTLIWGRTHVPLLMEAEQETGKERQMGSGEAFCSGTTSLPQNATPLLLPPSGEQPAPCMCSPTKCCTHTRGQRAG